MARFLRTFLLHALLVAGVPALAFAQTDESTPTTEDADQGAATAPSEGAGRQDQVVFAEEDEPEIPEWPTPIAFSWPMRSEAECKAQLEDFDWLCKLLEKGADYEGLYEKSYWELVLVRAYIDDLDGDGLKDLIYEQQGGGNCGSQGCYYSFIFGGHPQLTHPWPFSIQAGLDPAIVPGETEYGLQFAPDGAFWPIPAIKAEALRTIEAGGPLDVPGIDIPVPEEEAPEGDAAPAEDGAAAPEGEAAAPEAASTDQ